MCEKDLFGRGPFLCLKIAFWFYNLKEIYVTVGLIGKKIGMTRLFLEEGNSVAVTVLEIEPNRITQVKNEVENGYSSIQVTTGEGKQKKLAKPELGHFAKAKVGTTNPQTISNKGQSMQCTNEPARQPLEEPMICLLYTSPSPRD